ncbi:hypothetical protein AXH35_00145 [Acidipropionibacterium acidipropionici]|uniref:Amidoligase enzyme n=1 Tax=Acidipropionibacterium acidipropionici TaxID=1748 RepID=A0AAC8YBZ7_9ACTN|nr:hypothetical protein AXH35_00145 [Acidipropionibacterium acidipropionici]
MVCRQYALSSTVIAQVRTASWLDDAQIQSIYHTALHDPEVFGEHSDGWTRDQVLTTVVARARADIRYNPIWRPQRRSGLHTRLEINLEHDMAQMPRERLSALLRLPQAAAEAEHQLTSRLREIAGRRGMSEREARQEFYELRSQAPRGRQPRATDAERADLGLIPADPATRFALASMEERGPVRAPVREVDQWITVAPGSSTDPATTVAEVGVSSVSDRIELRYGDGHIEARQASDHDHIASITAQARTGRLSQTDAAGYAGLPPIPRADRNGWRVRCEVCGQFVGTQPHQCRGRTRVDTHPGTHHLDNGGELTVPPTGAIQRVLEDSEETETPVEIPVTYTGPAIIDDGTGAVTVSGTVRVRSGVSAIAEMESRNFSNLSFDDGGLDDTLHCERCGSGTCEHTSHTRAVLHQHLRRFGGIEPRPERTATAQATLISLSQRPTAPTATPVAPTPAVTRPPTLVFAEDPEAFRDFARLGASDGVPFNEGPALAGYAAGPDGEPTRFGVELEYYGEQGHRVRDAIVASGLVQSRTMNGYHDSAYRGWPTWSLEHDSSVDGELVTPVLSDTRQCWSQLQTACQAIHGAGATTDYAGSHVNISAATMGADQAFRLAHLFRAHQEDLARMGRTRGSIREPHYNPPLPDPGMTAWTQNDHYTMVRTMGRSEVNFAHLDARNPDTSRIEFRFPDASHDAGVIQGQVKLCAALTNYARATPDIPIGEHQPRGLHRRQHRAARFMALPATEWGIHTAGIRNLIDSLFDRDVDREQMARLWGRGNFF